MGHCFESVSDVEARNALPLVSLTVAEEESDHILRTVSASVYDGAAVYGRPLLP